MKSGLSSTGFLNDSVIFHFLIDSIEKKGIRKERFFKVICIIWSKMLTAFLEEGMGRV